MLKLLSLTWLWEEAEFLYFTEKGMPESFLATGIQSWFWCLALALTNALGALWKSDMEKSSHCYNINHTI